VEIAVGSRKGGKDKTDIPRGTKSRERSRERVSDTVKVADRRWEQNRSISMAVLSVAVFLECLQRMYVSNAVQSTILP
jgi:hypothetical protein